MADAATDSKELVRKMCIHCARVSEVSIDSENACKSCGVKDGLILLKPGQSAEDAIVSLKRTAQDLTNSSAAFFDEKGKFVPLLLGEEILAHYTLKSFTDTDEVYVYIKGTYRPGRAMVKAAAQFLLGSKTNSGRVAEAYEYVRTQTYVDRKEIEPPINIIALKNGLFDLDTLELKPFSEKYFFLNTLPIEYDPSADCPEFKKFLSEVLEPEDAEVIFELFAYTLHRAFPIERAIVLLGDGSNGKTVLMTALQEFLGQENYTCVPIQALGTNRFAGANLFQKLANLDGDLSSKALLDSSNFKRATGRSRMHAEKKGKDGFDFDNYAKFIFAANKLPKTLDNTYAFFRRWLIIPFERTFDDRTKDVNKAKKISTSVELSGIFNESIKRLKPLLIKGSFSFSTTVDEMRKQYIASSDPVRSFAEEFVEKDLKAYVEKDALYAAYGEFCLELEEEAIPRNKFFEKIKEIFPFVKYSRKGAASSGKQIPSVEGISLKGAPQNKIDGGQTTL